MSIIFLTIAILTVLFISLRTAKVVSKIKALRQKGVNLTRKNSYYKLVSTIFLDDLPM